MNQIRSIQKLSERELECGILKPESSWHHEYKDQAYINFGGMHLELTEADILTIFSQYGCPVDIKLVRDQTTGKSKGFGFLKYEDQRSTILAVDNLNGAKVCGRLIRVDHAFYRPRSDEAEYEEAVRQELEKDFSKTGDVPSEPIKQEPVADPLDEFADPMAAFLKK
ncbi:Ist3 [Kluyveromyces lactis]|nr:Ist3 [Kluyveromyces lactis]